MFGFAEMIMAQAEAINREAERQYWATCLEKVLETAPPEDHARIRAEHFAGTEKRRQERETERRHRELCQAIRDAGRDAAFPGHEPNAKGAQEILKLADQIRWDGSTRLVTEDPPPADYSWATDLSLNLWNSVAGISP